MDSGHRRRATFLSPLPLIFCVLVALVTAGTAGAGVGSAADWNEQVGRIAERWIGEARRRSKGAAHAGNVRVAVAAREIGAARDLIDRQADRAMRPASNMKLVTTAAALVLLGGGQEFATPFEARGPIEAGVLRGDLVVRAAGDPLCAADGDPRVEPRLAQVARKLRAAGLVEITGDLVLDEGTFPDPSAAPGWPDASQHWTEYCALSGGFTLNGGVLVAEVTPGAVGAAASIEVHPAPHGLGRRYGVRTTRDGDVDVRVGATTTAVTVRGTLPRAKRDFRAEFSHPDPVGFFGTVLRAELQRAGIRLHGTVRRERFVPAGTWLADLRSPVDNTLGPINAESRNGVADQLFLALGNAIEGQGTRAGGLRASVRALELLGVDATGFHQVDGSGLSRDDRASARQITRLLTAVFEREDEAPALFLDSLAVAGRRGTLDRRMRDTSAAGRVFAKTGWISGTSALSGLVQTLDGRWVAFSILVEYPAAIGGLNRSCFKPMQDEIATLLVEGKP